MGLCGSAKVHNHDTTAPEQPTAPEQEPDGVLDTDTEISLKDTYESIALHIIDYMSSEDRNEKEQLQEALTSVVKTAQGILTHLTDAPMGIGTGAMISRPDD